MNVDLFSSLAPTDDPRGDVVLAHGFGEHHGRYARFVKALNAAGYDTCRLHLKPASSESKPFVAWRNLQLECLLARKEFPVLPRKYHTLWHQRTPDRGPHGT